MIGAGLGLSNAVTVALAIALAFVFGYTLTAYGLRAQMPLRAALTIALSADTASIALMEAVDNVVMIWIPGAMNAPLTSALLYGALALSLAVAFVFAWPLNRWLMQRGMGHMKAHAHHHHGH